MKKFLVGAGVTAGALLMAASPAAAFFCTNANKQPSAGLAAEKTLGNGKTVLTGAYVDGALFGCDPGTTLFIRNGLHPAAEVGGDNGIVEADLSSCPEE